MSDKPQIIEISPPETFARSSLGMRARPTSTYAQIEPNPDLIYQNEGNRTFKIYDDILRDDQVQSCLQQRRTAVIRSEWDVFPGDESAEAIRAAELLKKNLESVKWDRITEKMHYGVFYGYSVAEVMWAIDGDMVSIADIHVRERERFAYDIDNNLYLKTAALTYEPMPDGKFWAFNFGGVSSDNPYGTGLAHFLYWPEHFKRNSQHFWLIYLEKFGMPTASAVAPASITDDPLKRDTLLAALDAIATETSVIIPEGVEVALIESTRSGSPTYEAMLNATNEAISKIILSQTMTTDNGSSLSQAQVHERVKQDVVKMDADLICESFNQQVVAWWMGFNFPEGVAHPKVWRNTEGDENLNERADRDAKIKSLGYDPTQEYIDATYGEGWGKAAAPVPPTGGANPLEPAVLADFAEKLRLADKKAQGRIDQRALIQGANDFATKGDLLAVQVKRILDFAESSGDYPQMQRHLTELFSRIPDEDSIRQVEQANIFSRLLGSLRGQNG
jgi:phage gp29-like protein